MEECKWRYMLDLLERTTDAVKTLDDCGEAISRLEDSARRCYADDVDFKSYSFAEILLVDGCFILELFQRCSEKNFIDNNNNDPIISSAWMVPTIRYDLALLENQIPFFVLEELFEIIKKFVCIDYALTDYALHFFRLALNLPSVNAVHTHILDVLHKFYRPTYPKTDAKDKKTCGFKHCATELLEAGIQFKKGSTDHLLDIKFRSSDGVIEIPPLCIDETMDSLFRNLIAFEQCSTHPSGSTHHITSHAMLIRSLIRSSLGVKLLQREGIIANNLAGGVDVTTFFDSVCEEVVQKEFYFGGVCEKVNEYHKSWLH